MMMMGRSWSVNEGYRFGFQGQEQDKELYDGAVSYKYRIHDPRIGRFLSIDPLSPKYPFYSPYAFSGNRVIDATELEGLEPELTNDGLITYRLQSNQGPTQIAEDMEQNYGEDVDWYDIVLMNEQNFTHMTAEERADKYHVKYTKNPAPAGETIFLLGTYEVNEQTQRVVIKPATKEEIDSWADKHLKEIERQREYNVRDGRTWLERFLNVDPNEWEKLFEAFGRKHQFNPVQNVVRDDGIGRQTKGENLPRRKKNNPTEIRRLRLTETNERKPLSTNYYNVDTLILNGNGDVKEVRSGGKDDYNPASKPMHRNAIVIPLKKK